MPAAALVDEEDYGYEYNAPVKKSRNVNGFLGSLGVWRRAVGLALLLLTVILWTASNFLASVGCMAVLGRSTHADR